MEQKCKKCEEDITKEYMRSNLKKTLCNKCLGNLEYGHHEGHPEWKELCRMCGEIETLKDRATKLREKIDKDVFNKKLLKKEVSNSSQA